MPNLPSIFDRAFNRNSNPLRSLAKMERQMDHLFDRMLGETDSEIDVMVPIFSPSCNVEETDSHYLLSFDVPGVKREDLNVDLRGQILTVSGERKQESEKKNGKTYRAESSYGSFQRSFELPADVKAEQIETQFEHGVLKIAVPKTESSKAKKIAIGEGAESGVFGKQIAQKEERKATH